MIKKLVVVLLCCMLQFEAFAFQSPVTRMQNTMSGVVQQKMHSRGFASSDPRWSGTLSQISGAVAGAAASALVVTVAGVTAPAWITAGVAMGVGALVTTGVSLAVGGAVNWLFGSDGTVKQSEPDTLNVPGGYAPKTVYCFLGTGHCAGTPEALCKSENLSSGQLSFVSGTCHWIDADGVDRGSFRQIQTTNGCIGISVATVSGVCGPSNFPIPQPVVMPVGDAIEALPAPERIKPLNPGVIADLANDAWQRAAALPGYDGLPYDATNPITQADVEAWRATNPDSYPTVGDVLAPQPAPAGAPASSPWVLPNTAAPVPSYDPAQQPSTGTNPSTQPQENLGPDPGIGFPTLENIPTVEQILDPIFSLFSGFKNYVVPSHQGACPTGSVDLFDAHVSFDSHCALMSDATNQSIIAAAMLVVWSLVALRIVLSA